jgi:hypothetical protein
MSSAKLNAPSTREMERINWIATALPAPNTWSAYPFPSTIMLYKEGHGYPTFDPAKATKYFTKVNDKIACLIQETIRKWYKARV